MDHLLKDRPEKEEKRGFMLELHGPEGGNAPCDYSDDLPMPSPPK
jgi:hypothetical protein